MNPKYELIKKVPPVPVDFILDVEFGEDEILDADFIENENLDFWFKDQILTSVCSCEASLHGEKPLGIKWVKQLSSLPTIGLDNVIYAFVDEHNELSLYYWDNISCLYHKIEESYDIIDGGNAFSQKYVTYSK